MKFLCLARGAVSQVITAQADETLLEYAADFFIGMSDIILQFGFVL